MARNTQAPTPRRRSLATALAVSTVMAVILAALIHMWTAQAGLATAPIASPTSTVTRYALDPTALLLTAADVDPDFSIVIDEALGPTQRTAYPLPYQKELVGGRLRDIMITAALSPQSRAEIGNWQQARGFTPTNPPSIFGPFVAEHRGIFEMYDAVLSYQTTDAARQDYHCCTYPNLDENYADYTTLPAQLGEEADAWSGIRISPTNPPAEYEEQVYHIHWRRGPVVMTLWVLGSHDITFSDALRWANLIDQRIVQNLGEP